MGRGWGWGGCPGELDSSLESSLSLSCTEGAGGLCLGNGARGDHGDSLLLPSAVLRLPEARQAATVSFSTSLGFCRGIRALIPCPQDLYLSQDLMDYGSISFLAHSWL